MKIYKISIQGDNHSGLIKSDMIIKEQKGEYVGKATNYYNQTTNYVSDLLGDSVFNEPTLMQIKGCSIYRFPKLSLPRQKVDHLKQSADISITRNQDTADYHIVSSKYLDSFFEASWSGFLTPEQFKDLLTLTKNCFTNDAGIKINSFVSEECLYELNIQYNWNNNNPNLQTIRSEYRSIINKIDNSNDRDIYVPTKFHNDYVSIKSNSKLVLDSYIKSLCDEGLHVLTTEEAENLEKILRTDDVENLTLALEMMSNCNLSKSFDLVSYLYYFNYDNLKMASNWNNINAKTLRKSLENFNPYSNNGAHYYERYLKELIKADNLTEWSFKAAARKMFYGGLESFGINKDVFTIKLENIELNDKYKGSLKETTTPEQILQDLTMDPLHDDLPF